MNVTIIADASHCPDTLAAGYGFWIASERGKEGGGGSFRIPVDNNNAAEMMAVCNAMYQALQWSLVCEGDTLLLQTDCLAAIDAFKGKRSKLSENEKQALTYFRLLRSEHNLTVQFRHVKGHTRRQEARFVTNNLCDKRAKQGMRLARKQFGLGV